MEISVVIPVYKAENIVDELLQRLNYELEHITKDYEIILINDGSPDDSWGKILTHCTNDQHIKGVLLSRNFGQHHAITAGLDMSTGKWIVVMDCDLQDRPEEINKLYNEALNGFDIVFARRVRRKDGLFKKTSSILFYKIFSYLSGIKQDGTIANFGIYSRKVINAINSIREPVRAFSPIARWVGFKRTSIEVEHGERFEGKSSYNWNNLLILAINIAIAYSDKPLKLVIKLGFWITILSILYSVFNFLLYFLGVIKLTGYTSLIISIWFLSGLIILILGVVGLYVGKIFEGVKQRPIYLVDQKINFTNE